MKIGVIGATGKAGRLIAAEAALRGHAVTAIVRDGKKIKNKDYAILQKDLYDLNAKDLDRFDAVVDAFGTPFDAESADGHVNSLEHLIKVFEHLPKTRLLVVGGAGSLYTDESRTHRVIENIPKEWRATPERMAAAFEQLQKSAINWTYFSPAITFDPAGGRTLAYTVSGDVAALNAKGESYISYADYASAMIDEIEQKKHVKARFTAAGEKPEFSFPSKEIPYFGLLEKRPVFEGMSRYRPPRNFELAGRQYRLILDSGQTATINFTSGDTLLWSETGAEALPSGSAIYECAKIDEITYFVNFEFEGYKPRVNITLVLDLEQNLFSRVRTWTRFDPKHPTLCDNEVVFGAIAMYGFPLNEKRHCFTTDLVGKRIHWHYSPELEIIHVYYNPHYMSVTFPEGYGWGGMPPDVWNAILEANPYDEPAWFVKIKENIYLISCIEKNMALRGMGGNSLLFLLDAKRVHDVGRSFGHTGQAPEFLPENYLFGAYGDWEYSDGAIEAKRNKDK